MKTYRPVGINSVAYAKSETTTCNILTAARTMFLAKNYADVSMAGIAEAAGVTKGALYHHFQSKEALYVAMMCKFLRELQAIFEAERKNTGTCRERLHRSTLLFFHLPRDKPALLQLVRRDLNKFKGPTRQQLIRAYQAALPEQMEAIVRDGIRNGELVPVDPRLLSWLKVAMVEVCRSRYSQSLFKDANETVDFIIDLLFDGIGAKPSVHPRPPARRGSPTSLKRIPARHTAVVNNKRRP